MVSRKLFNCFCSMELMSTLVTMCTYVFWFFHVFIVSPFVFRGRTALHISSLNGHRQVVELLLDSGAHIHARDYLLLGSFVCHFDFFAF